MFAGIKSYFTWRRSPWRAPNRETREGEYKNKQQKIGQSAKFTHRKAESAQKLFESETGAARERRDLSPVLHLRVYCELWEKGAAENL
jgi:hypothetical protein